jgi:predicted nucleic acid-binding protein
MIAAPFKVVLDACVLYPFALRDTLLRSAAEGLFQLSWSTQILEETRRNLVGSQTVTHAQGERLIVAMMRAFPEAAITGYEALIPAMKNHAQDRHVAAAALKAGAQVIVTNNLKDFHDLPDGIEAQSPDTFLCNLFDLDPERIVALIRQQASDLQRPPRTFEELLAGLAKLVPDFADAVLAHVAR